MSPVRVGVRKETATGERRVALVPDLVSKLSRAGLSVLLQEGSGTEAGFSDSAYRQAGAQVVADPPDADVHLWVQPPAAEDLGSLKAQAMVIGLLQPYRSGALFARLAALNVTSFAMELMPRITRAQPMDALSAMSTVAGYKAVVLAAARLPKFFPLLMTAAGTVQPARVFVVGAGVAGLQAIGTARRLGAVVHAYDTRPVVREQVESLGANFADLGMESTDAQEKTGYAKAQSEEFYERQRALMARFVAEADAVIPTALVPGRRAPVLITQEMVEGMRPGSVIVDLAAEQGGNCALTTPGREVLHQGVSILGPLNLPSTMAYHASQMYARTVTNYLLHLVKDGAVRLDLEDELTRGPMVTHQGKVVHEAAAATAGAVS